MRRSRSRGRGNGGIRHGRTILRRPWRHYRVHRTRTWVCVPFPPVDSSFLLFRDRGLNKVDEQPLSSQADRTKVKDEGLTTSDTNTLRKSLALIGTFDSLLESGVLLSHLPLVSPLPFRFLHWRTKKFLRRFLLVPCHDM